MAEALFFYIFATLMVVAAVAVIANRHPIYSVLSLLVVMLSLAALFVMLGAFFLAALQVLLYAGAVLVLFLFVIMLLNLQPAELARQRASMRRSVAILAAALFFFALLSTFLAQPDKQPVYPVAKLAGTVESIGRSLFTTYFLPFELASFLILAAIIGAVILARQQPKK